MKQLRRILFSEQNLFYLLVFSGLIPLLFTKYYPTLDGPAHLYNGKLIRELILGQYDEFGNLFVFNKQPVPNWISHVLFASIGYLLPDFLTEKLVLMTYLVTTPIYFRKITLHLAPDNRQLSYLIIPFCHNHLLYLGFFNLVFAIPLMLVTIYFILRRLESLQIRHLFPLSLLLLIVYFSHLMIFMITVLVILLLPIKNIQISYQGKSLKINKLNDYFRVALKIALAAAPALFLAGNYIIRVDSLENASRIGMGQLLDMLVNVEPLITLAYNYPWLAYTKLMFLLFIVLLFSNIIRIIKKKQGRLQSGQIHASPQISWIWLGLAVTFLLLYLIVPNANLLTERLIFIFYLFLLLALAVLTYPKMIKYIAVGVILIVQFTFVRMHSVHMQPLSKKAVQINDITSTVEPGSLLLTFNFSDSWLDMHSSGYYGTGNHVIVLEDYEAQLNWFPLKWNLKGPSELGKLNTWDANNRKLVESFYCHPTNPDLFTLQQKDGALKEIPYVVILGEADNETDENSQLIKSILDKSYQLIRYNDYCKLYRLNTLSN